MPSKPPRMQVLPENIPDFLKSQDNWILWRWSWNRKKWDKPPLQRDGRKASVVDRYTWCSFDEAFNTYDLEDFDGIGVVLPDGSAGVDIDDCMVGESLSHEAKLILSMFPTYTEVSPSGTGVKLIAIGHVDPSMKAIDHQRGIEMYEGGTSPRYFTITGNVLDDNHREIVECRQGLANLQAMISDPLPQENKEDAETDPLAKAKALACLNHITKNNGYWDWMQVGMALRHVEDSEEMLQAWTRWSSASDSFVDEEDCRHKWESFKRQEGKLVTLKHLLRLAQREGYNPDKFQTGLTEGLDLMHDTTEHEYLIDEILVINEPMVIGGPAKCLKTSLALEMAVCLASGQPFLNEYKVSRPVKTLFISGESGKLTIRDTLNQIVQARGFDEELLRGMLYCSFNLPKLDNLKQVEDLVEELTAAEIEVIFIDPLYLSMSPGDQAGNLYSMGDKLKYVADRIIVAGMTPILCHHFRKTGKQWWYAPELEDLSQSGVAEFARQVLLLKRKCAYKMDGCHTLWFYHGGSAGHQGLKVLEAHTGTRATGLTWGTTLRSETEYEATQKETAQVSQDDRRAQADAEAHKAILDAVDVEPKIAIPRLMGMTGMGRRVVERHLDTLLSQDLLCEGKGQRQARVFFKTPTNEGG